MWSTLQRLAVRTPDLRGRFSLDPPDDDGRMTLDLHADDDDLMHRLVSAVKHELTLVLGFLEGDVVEHRTAVPDVAGAQH